MLMRTRTAGSGLKDEPARGNVRAVMRNESGRTGRFRAKRKGRPEPPHIRSRSRPPSHQAIGRLLTSWAKVCPAMNEAPPEIDKDAQHEQHGEALLSDDEPSLEPLGKQHGVASHTPTKKRPPKRALSWRAGGMGVSRGALRMDLITASCFGMMPRQISLAQPTARYARPKYAKLKRSSTVTAPTSSIASIAPMTITLRARCTFHYTARNHTRYPYSLRITLS
jgi:hypothetical protein